MDGGSILILSINNPTNYLFAKYILENTDLSVKCLFINESCAKIHDIMDNDRFSIINIDHMCNNTKSDNDNNDNNDNNDHELLTDEVTCKLKSDYAFFDTHYRKHSNPEIEIEEWKLINNIIGNANFKKIIVTAYKDTRKFKNLKVDQIRGYNVPHCDSRAEGINNITNNIDKIIYLYPPLFWNYFLTIFNPIKNLEGTYDFHLPICPDSIIYGMDIHDYIKIIYNVLERGVSIDTNKIYNITGEILDMSFITYILSDTLGIEINLKKVESVSNNINLYQREWYNYFKITEQYNKELEKNYESTQFLFGNIKCFYTWIKDNKKQWDTILSSEPSRSLF